MMSRKKALTWFLTFPQLGEDRPDTPQESLERFKLFWATRCPRNPLREAIVGHEDHEPREEDGNEDHGVHVHLVFKVTTRWNCPSDMRFFDDLFNGHHPNIQTCRDFQKSVRYSGKDGDYATFNLDYDAICKALDNKKGYSWNCAAKALNEGKTLDEVNNEAPGFLARNKRALDYYVEYLEEKRVRTDPRPQFPGFEDVEDEDWQEVVNWANKNFLEPRAPRQPQLWLWSETPGLGKSFPWDFLMPQYFRQYEWVRGEKQSKELMLCDYIFFDDFSGFVTVQQLKRILQGYGFTQDLKYGGICKFRKNVPVVITCNRDPKSVFKNVPVQELESLEDRLNVIHVETVCHLKLKELPPPVFGPPLPPDYQPELEDSDEDHSEHSNEERHRDRSPFYVPPEPRQQPVIYPNLDDDDLKTAGLLAGLDDGHLGDEVLTPCYQPLPQLDNDDQEENSLLEDSSESTEE